MSPRGCCHLLVAKVMNLLRLPRFSSKQRLKEKLLYAITTASHGFGLT